MVCAPVVLRASESYSVPAKPGLEEGKYALGQKIFSGKQKLPEADAKLAEKQEPKLKKLQEMLPKEAQEKAKLASLAGKLNDEQLTALQYFVEKRYGKK